MVRCYEIGAISKSYRVFKCVVASVYARYG
jgi:hypothetical protein